MGSDWCGPFPDGYSIFVAVDYYSQWPEVAVMKKTTAENTIQCLEEMFSRHGVPLKFICDNGPQFISQDFKQFAMTYGFEIQHSIPLWPQANGEVERFNKTILKAIRIGKAEGKE